MIDRHSGLHPGAASLRLFWGTAALAIACFSGAFLLAAPCAAAGSAGKPQFDPPEPEDAPSNMRDAVMLGYHLLHDTQKYAKDYVGNQLSCTNCHFDAGRSKQGLSLVGVGATYPKYLDRSHFSTDLVARVNGCMKRSLNGKPLPPDGREMQGVMAYLQWISKGIPIYDQVPWLGVKRLPGATKASASQGKQVFANVCSRCHGDNGQGTSKAPPLWGSGSYNDGAGMSHPEVLAGFAHQYMPKGNPDLTEQQAEQAAAYVDSQPRPHFSQKKGPDDVW